MKKGVKKLKMEKMNTAAARIQQQQQEVTSPLPSMKKAMTTMNKETAKQDLMEKTMETYTFDVNQHMALTKEEKIKLEKLEEYNSFFLHLPVQALNP